MRPSMRSIARQLDAQHRPSACFGGQGVDPYEQKTQQSPLFGRSKAPHAEQS